MLLLLTVSWWLHVTSITELTIIYNYTWKKPEFQHYLVLFEVTLWVPVLQFSINGHFSQSRLSTLQFSAFFCKKASEASLIKIRGFFFLCNGAHFCVNVEITKWIFWINWHNSYYYLGGGIIIYTSSYFWTCIKIWYVSRFGLNDKYNGFVGSYIWMKTCLWYPKYLFFGKLFITDIIA